MGFAQKIGDTVRYPKYTTNLIGKLVFINHCGFGVSCIRFSDKPSYQKQRLHLKKNGMEVNSRTMINE